LPVGFSDLGYGSLRVVLVSILSLLFAVIAPAQMASLRGRVFDQTGAALPGAVVTLRGPHRAISTATAASDGSYEFPLLAPGSYQVSASAPQLASPEAVRITIATGHTTLDLKLRVVSQQQEIRVDDAGAPAVGTDSAANAGAVIIQGNDLQALGDDAQDLQADLQALAGPAAGPSGGAIYIDGFSGGQMPAKESIREVRINQNPFAPEYDKLGFGRVEIFTKPGSDHWKGTLGFNFANQIWNSRNPYATEKAPLHLQEYENSFGGPLGHKTSFTMDLERHAVDNGYISNGEWLNSTTLEPEPFNTVHVTPQRHTLVSPLFEYQLTSADTASLRYNFTDASVNGAGISGFDDASRGCKLNNKFQTVQVSDTHASKMWINETRLQYFRWAQSTDPFTAAPMLQVLGAFNSGGATVGQGADTQNNFEFQDYMSVIHGGHSWRFGARLREGREISVARDDFNGTFTFTSLDIYRQTLLGVPGYGPSQFSQTAGQPESAVRQFDAGIFGSDEWKVRPDATVSYGLRYEMQTNIGDRTNFAPRAAVAWAPGHPPDGRTTVLRAGAGIFYDRFPLFDVLTALRFNGTEQLQYVVSSPKGFPSMPDLAALAGSGSQQVVWQRDSRLRAPYIVQSSFSVEQQATRTTALAFTYTNSHGLHELRSRVLNAGSTTPVFMMTSSGLYNQNQVTASFRTKPSQQVSLFGYYVYNRASSNTDGLSTFPQNPSSDSGEYGPAATDVRHRFLVGGSMQMRGNIRISPYVMFQSGTPFNITTGQDRYGTTLLNSRPGIAAAPGTGIVPTSYGLLDSNPVAGEPILPRNFGRGPAQFTVNLRAGKTIGIGPIKAESIAKSQTGSQIDAANMSAPGGLRGLFAAPSSDRRFGLSIGMSARNLLNHTNEGPIIGDITSSLFGRANQLAGSANMEGFMENASNRRLELQIKFIF
jgi:hypothetical protein